MSCGAVRCLQIGTTPFVRRTRNPRWNTVAEVLVRDVRRAQLSFYVFDWDGFGSLQDDFLGYAQSRVASVRTNANGAAPGAGAGAGALPNDGDALLSVPEHCARYTTLVPLVFRGGARGRSNANSAAAPPLSNIGTRTPRTRDSRPDPLSATSIVRSLFALFIVLEFSSLLCMHSYCTIQIQITCTLY